jgi:hypothetical protein
LKILNEKWKNCLVAQGNRQGTKAIEVARLGHHGYALDAVVNF